MCLRNQVSKKDNVSAQKSEAVLTNKRQTQKAMLFVWFFNRSSPLCVFSVSTQQAHDRTGHVHK